MKILLIIGLVLASTACAPAGFRRASDCHARKDGNKTLIECEDGTVSEIDDGANGNDGLNGSNGKDGVDGKDGLTLYAGVNCNVHDLASWNSSTSLPQAMISNPAVGSFDLPNFNVGDSQASNGFPGMPASIRAKVGDEGYILDCYGYLKVPTSGVYKFNLFSDDGSRLVIEDSVVVENQGLHAPLTVSGSINLNRGFNRINVVYYQGPYTQIALQLKWTGPNTTESVVPASALYHL